MTALAADRKTSMKEGELVAIPVAAATTIYLGGLVMINAAGNAIPAADAASSKFAGVAQDSIDNSAGAAGDLSVQVRKTGVHSFVAAGLALTDLGAKVFVADDQTVDLTGGTNFVFCGRIDVFTVATVAHVDISTGAFARTHGVGQIQSPDGSDLATTQTLANEIKAALNL